MNDGGVANTVLSVVSRIWAAVNWAARPLLSRAARRLPVPVISVGNILAGGVGKTEVVSLLARYLISKGYRVTIALRGAGSSLQNQGAIAQDFSEALRKGLSDEALVHLVKAPQAKVAMGARRGKVLMQHWQELKPDVVLLDDGYQHFSLIRDLDILVHDFSVQNPIYRDFKCHLDHAAVKIGLGTVDPNRASDGPWVRGRYTWRGLQKADTQGRFTGVSSGAPFDAQIPVAVRAFCGIGNPQRFEKFLKDSGIAVTQFLTFSDHCSYDPNGIAFSKLKEWAGGTEPVVTTLKDYVKLMPYLTALPFELSIVSVDLELTQNAPLLFEAVDQVMFRFMHRDGGAILK